jgi:outer membrane receptor protein involved in Fe transport
MSSPGSTVNGQSQFSISNSLNNPDLRPENINTREVGIESAFWQNRIRLDVALYNKITRDQIMNIEVPSSSGYSYQLINAGRVDNRGVEVSLGMDLFKNPNGFNWTTTLNWSKDKSTVKELAPGLDTYTLGEEWSCFNFAMVGETWGTLVGAGLYRDKNGNPVVDEYGFPLVEDNIKIGDVTPDWLAGWSNEFSYKDLSFGFLLDYRKGGDFFSVSQMFGAYTGIYDYTTFDNMRENGAVFGKNICPDLNFVNEDGTTNTTVVDPEEAFFYFYDVKELSVIDGSFLKLREAHLTYNLPASLTRKVKWIDSAKISLVGNNLAILWLAKNNYTRIDPESSLGSGNSSVGFESNACPPSRSFGIKLNVTF